MRNIQNSHNNDSYATNNNVVLSRTIAIVFGIDLFRLIRPAGYFVFTLLLTSLPAFAQTYGYQAGGYPTDYVRKSAFQQEIARLEITVERAGQTPLPISMVPRVQKDDLLRVHMLEEAISGIKPDESYWDWTLVVAFVNPARNEIEDESVSREVNFRREGWYREHLFKVPYDSQPVFFLYPKEKYRKKIRKLINKNFGEIKKIGEKTLEIAGAYAQIGIFLNELQKTINQNPYGYSSYNYGTGSPYGEQFLQNQLVERLAQSFNIGLPSCWNSSGSYYGTNDFVSRAQCVAKNVRLEDFDLSVGRMLQQGGLLAATKLVEKYPQLAYWINVAAAAADLIIKIMKKTPMKVVPTLAQTRDEQNQYNQYNSNNNDTSQNLQPIKQKISIFAENPPTDSDFVTAFPIVLHNWQADPDPEVISLPVPSLLEPCLHTGQNILKNTDLSFDWLRDDFARDFRLVMSADNGFSKEFRLTKNLGMSGWMLLLNPQDTQAFPKVKMNLTAKITATRGFKRIESPEFAIPISGGGEWEVTAESENEFSVGGKRRIVVKNSQGSCRCLQSVVYKPSFGGEFTFSANAAANPLVFNEFGSEASFEIDTTYFQPGQGTLEFRTYGIDQQPQNKQLKLFPLAPEITKVKAYRGDKYVVIEGNRIEQIQMLLVNNKLARLDTNVQDNSANPNSNQKTFVFQNPNNLILENEANLEFLLEGERRYKYPGSFPVSPAKPNIESNEKHEIDGLTPETGKVKGFDLNAYPVLPIDTEEIVIAVRSTLADYSFKAENISIETRIENGQVGQESLPQTRYEVLDSFSLKIGFQFNDQNMQFLAGRRLEFRIKDRQRGDSNWYKIKQTFVRAPTIDSIVCKNGECRISGSGLDYIGQISTDSSNIWQPAPQVLPTTEGKSAMTIQGAKNKKLLKIKLRDFPSMEGVFIEPVR